MVRKRKKRKLKIKNIIIAFIILITIIVLGYIGINKLINIKTNDTQNNNTTNKEENKEENYSISMIMAGDNLIHSSIYKDAIDENGNYDFTPMYELIKPIVSKYDVAYYNQETILGGKELGVSDYPTFNSPQEVGDAMIDAGFNLVSLATNHTMDSGEKAVLNSKEYWNNQKDILAVGSYSSNEEKEKINIITKNNITYTMLNYTYGTNGINVPDNKEYLVNVWPTNLETNDINNDNEYQEYKKQVKKDIEKVRDKVDVLIVAMHWGVEYTHEPTEYQKDMAKYLADLDVDIIIGTHPHVIQPITWIDDTLVIYSLGNFISAQYQDQNYNKMVGLLTSLKINKNIKNGETKITIDDINNELTYTYYNNWRNFKVVPFSNSEISQYLPDYQSVYNTYKDIVLNYDDTINIENCYQCQ